MHRILDSNPADGTVQAYRHLRPIRTAWLIPDDDYRQVVSLVELLSQTWNGVSDLLIPICATNGVVEECYLDLLRRTELDEVACLTVNSLPADTRSTAESLVKQVGFRLSPGSRGHPALLVAASRNRDQLLPITSVTIPEGNPWCLAYLTMCGRLSARPDRNLLALAGAKEDLSYDEVLEVRHEMAEEPGLADLKTRLSVGHPLSLSRIALTSQETSSFSVNAIDGWLKEPDLWARQKSHEVAVLYEPESVTDACMLWNLRAFFGWPRGMPLGIPYERQMDGTPDLQAMAASVLDIKHHFEKYLPDSALASTGLSIEELSTVAEMVSVKGSTFEVLQKEEALVAARPAARSSAITLTFQQGSAFVVTRTDEDREWLKVTGRRTLPLKVMVQAVNQPIATSVAMRGSAWWMQYGGGGAVVNAGKDTIQEVMWPQRWTMMEAVAHDHGLRVEESVNGRHALALTRLLGDPIELRWLCHRGLLDLLYKLAASTSMTWWKKRTTEQAKVVAAAQENPEQAMMEFKALIADVNVSHDAETSGSFNFEDVKKALRGERSTATAWLKWAEKRRLVQRLVQLTCERCENKMLRELGQALPPLPCVRCGLSMTAPFGLDNLPFRYRLSEPLRRSIDDDSIYHALIMRWLISVFQNSSGRLVGAHPGVDFYRGKQQIGEADIVLLFADGTVIPVEVKRSGRQLTDDEVGKLRVLAHALDSPAVVLGAGDLHTFCPAAIQYDSEDGSCRVITADYWLNPQPRVALGWKDIPHWNTEPHVVPSVDEYENNFARMLVAAEKRKFGAEDPVRDLWQSNMP